MKLSIILLLMGSVICCGVVAGESILIKLNQNAYTTEDNFEVKITALNDESMDYLGLSIEVKKGDSWQLVRSDTSCPCMAKCKKQIVKLGKGELIEESWDFKDSNCNMVTAGTFRAVVLGDYDFELNRNAVLATSDEFEIKSNE